MHGLGVEDLPGSLRQQQILGDRQRRRPPGRGPGLCRSHRHPPGRRASSASMRRCFGRGQTIYDPWHYVPVLARKPGALRNGAPFKDWVLPAALERVRRKLARLRRRRPADGRDPGRRADRRAAGGRSRLRRGAEPGRPLVRRDPQHPGAHDATPDRLRPSSRRRRCRCGTRRSPIAPATTA